MSRILHVKGLETQYKIVSNIVHNGLIAGGEILLQMKKLIHYRLHYIICINKQHCVQCPSKNHSQPDEIAFI